MSLAAEFQRLINRANAIAEGLGVISTILDAEVVRRVGESTQVTADLI